jgi:dipeptidase E
MKLLLTSSGITNPTIAKALLDLVGKPAEEISLAFIPTAMNPEGRDKSWFIRNLNEFKSQNFKMIDIVDISALPREVWQPRLEGADILFFSGGNTPHLMRWIEESGLKELLPELLKTRVWAGISAGSIVTAPTLELSNKDKMIFYEKNYGYKANKGLGLVDFHIRPHLNSPKFPNARKEVLEEVAKEIPQTIYAIDDQMALKVVDGVVEVVGEGEYLVFNK